MDADHTGGIRAIGKLESPWGRECLEKAVSPGKGTAEGGRPIATIGKRALIAAPAAYDLDHPFCPVLVTMDVGVLFGHGE
jgi:hypothetical protein